MSFGKENYTALTTKAAVLAARLMKRADQSRMVLLASHLFWQDNGDVKRPEGRAPMREGKRVLECLQRSLKIADSVLDKSVACSLFVEILEKYLWYYNRKTDLVSGCFLVC